MSFLELAKKRYSVRKYKNTPIEKEKLLQVLEVGRIAPSACNLQPWQFIVVQDPEIKNKVAETYKREWILGAPAIIVACGDHSQSWKRTDGKDHCDVDVSIAIDHMTLAAADVGLGTCWVCAFDAAQCHQILSLPEHMEVIALLPIGYPANEVNMNRHDEKRKKLEEVVHWDEF